MLRSVAYTKLYIGVVWSTCRYQVENKCGRLCKSPLIKRDILRALRAEYLNVSLSF
jgi:hypothetical protein